MRTTLNLDDDVLILARQVAERDRISLGEAVCRLVRQGAGAQGAQAVEPQPLRGRFALLPRRDEVITPAHVRDLMDREGI